jgi:large subunit ribosomal protein L29
MKASDYRDLTVEELRLREEEMRKSLFNLRIRATTKELENVARIRQEKRELARLLTVLSAKMKTEKLPA